MKNLSDFNWNIKMKGFNLSIYGSYYMYGIGKCLNFVSVSDWVTELVSMAVQFFFLRYGITIENLSE